LVGREREDQRGKRKQLGLGIIWEKELEIGKFEAEGKNGRKLELGKFGGRERVVTAEKSGREEETWFQKISKTTLLWITGNCETYIL